MNGVREEYSIKVKQTSKGIWYCDGLQVISEKITGLKLELDSLMTQIEEVLTEHNAEEPIDVKVDKLMDNQALAETYVDLWLYIDKDFNNKKSNGYADTTIDMVFEQTCKRIISDLIGKQRSSGGSTQSSGSSDKPSEKQIAWAKKLGCNKPEGFSRKELSEWLDNHKND